MTVLLESTPKIDGFSMPGEFEPHSGCWMVWPERSDNWRAGAKPAQQAFVDVAEAIHVSDPVTMAVSRHQYANARARLSSGIRVIEMSSNDSWMRDIGPTFLINRQGVLRAVDWQFNSWGGLYNGLYSPWDLDDAVAIKVAEIEAVDRYRAPFVLEGGSIHCDGEGTVITTEECLLSPGRNPAMSRQQIDQALQDYLGIDKVIWVPRGVFLDETTGHVDNILHYCAPGVVALSWTDDTKDPQYERSLEALEFLESVTDAKGRNLKVIKIHQPGPLFMEAGESATIDVAEGTVYRKPGERLAGSYCNFYIGNSRIVYPLLDQKYDAKAKEQLQKIFPQHEVVGVPGREILLGGGNIHCITQQVPLAVND